MGMKMQAYYCAEFRYQTELLDCWYGTFCLSDPISIGTAANITWKFLRLSIMASLIDA